MTRRVKWWGMLALTTCLVSVAQAADLSFSATPLDEEAQTTLRQQTLTNGLIDEDVSDGQRLLAAARSDYARIVSALYDLGYYAPTVSITLDGREAAEIAPTRSPETVNRVQISVDPGRQFRFSRAQVGPLAEGTVLPRNFEEDEVAQATRLRDAADAAISGWRDLGHAKARISDQSFSANHPNATLDAVIRVDPGPQLRFGELLITGETAVRATRIREIAGVPTGKVFSPAQLEAAEERLRRTGAFRVARLTEGETLDSAGALPIEAQIVDAKPRRIGFGAEVSSTDGVTVSGYWMHRNFFGGAERFRVDAEVAQIGGQGGQDERLTFRFDRPATIRPRIDLYALAEFESLDEPDFMLERAAVETGLSFRADRRRTFTLGVGAEAVRSEDAFGSRDYRLLTLPFTAEYDARNIPLDATSGWYGKAELLPFLANGDVSSGGRIKLDLRGYRAIAPDDRVVLALRGQLGSVVGPALDRSPTEMLFYSGGTSTVRGHGYQSLGIDLPSGETVGGKSFVGLSAEIRIKGRRKLDVVGFYDVGYVSADEVPGRGGEMHAGAGIGLRYDTGIGPIRLDVAAPVAGDGEGVQLYIGIGQAF